MFVEYIEKISSLIEDSATSILVVLGDNNAAANSSFESELFDFCNTHQLVVSDDVALGRESGQYFYVSDAHCTTSGLITCYDVKICRRN